MEKYDLLEAARREYRICTRCVMDTTVPDIEFDEQGVCNYCKAAAKRIDEELFAGPQYEEALEQIIADIRHAGKGKPYDCVLGVSGGMDSSYVALMAKRLGLRPLAVHLDNGWNSELAVSNIQNLVEKLNFDLKTYVLDWEEFRDIQKSFLKSSLANAEIPTDHAINALLYQTASELNIKYILGGGNLTTEVIMPDSWMQNPVDLRLIKYVQKKYGTKKIRNLPRQSIWEFLYRIFIKRIKQVTLLNFIDYNKQEVFKELEREIGWRPYEAKHFESTYTRFFQGYYLPRKFGIDKRRAHFSSLIVAGHMDRDEALRELQRNDYLTQHGERDREYVCKKLSIREEEFEQIMADPPRYADYFNSYRFVFENLGFVTHWVKKVGASRGKLIDMKAEFAKSKRS